MRSIFNGESTNNKPEQIRKEEEVKTTTTPKIGAIEKTSNLFLWRSIEHVIMKRPVLLTHVLAFGLLFITSLIPICQAAHAQGNTPKNFDPPPFVFQAAGPTADSIQSTVDAFRAALGNTNLNNTEPLYSGRSEINWDGGNTTNVTTTDPVTPFNVFLNTRGAQFTTPGIGLSQAAPSGLAVLFNNPTYDDIFSTFSPSRLFTPVGSNITEAL